MSDEESELLMDRTPLTGPVFSNPFLLGMVWQRQMLQASLQIMVPCVQQGAKVWLGMAQVK